MVNFRGGNVIKFQELKVKTPKREVLVNISGEINKLVKDSGVNEGVCRIFVPHTTAGVTINENADPSVTRDIVTEMTKIVPTDDNYHHAEGNSAAHIKASLFGNCETLFVEDGKLVLGTWQGIYLCEFDGPRTRKVHVKILREE